MRREDDDGDGTLGPDLAQHLHTGLIRQHHIQQDEIVCVFFYGLDAGYPRSAVIEDHILQFEVIPGELTEFFIVVNQQYPDVIFIAHERVPVEGILFKENQSLLTQKKSILEEKNCKKKRKEGVAGRG